VAQEKKEIPAQGWQIMGNIINAYGLGAVIQFQNKASKVIRQVQRDFAGFKASTQRDVANIRAASEHVGTSFRNMRRGMMKDVKMMAAGVAMAAPIALMGKAAAESEDRLGDILSLLVTNRGFDSARKDILELREEMFQVGADSRVVYKNIETAGYKIASAFGGNIDIAKGIIGSVSDVAIAAKGTMEESTRTMTTIMDTYAHSWIDLNSYKEKAARAGNYLSGTVAAFNTDLSQLSEGLQYTLGPANALGIAFEEMSATVAAAQTKGLAPSRAGTAYVAFLREATELVDKSGKKVKDAMSMADRLNIINQGGELKAKSSLAGLELADASGKFKPIYEIIEQIETRLGISSDKMAQMAAQGISGEDALRKIGIPVSQYADIQKSFGDEGSRILLLLLGQSGALKESIKLIRDSNSLEKMKAARMMWLIPQIQRAKNKFSELAIKIGENLLPELTEFTTWAGNRFESAANLVGEYPNTTKWGLKIFSGGALGLIGLGLARFIGRAIKFAVGAIPSLITIISQGAKVLWGFRGAFGSVIGALSKFAGPLGVITSILSLTPKEMISDAWNNLFKWDVDFSWFKKQFSTIWDALPDELTSVIEKANNYLAGSFEKFGQRMGAWGERLAFDFKALYHKIYPDNKSYEWAGLSHGRQPSPSLALYNELGYEGYSQKERLDSLQSAGLPIDRDELGMFRKESKGTVTINKKIQLDVNMTGNIGYDIESLYRGIKRKLTEDDTLGIEGQM
jgi:TP901 family phage tail tape measure protein